jgi:hypothetical protein
LIEALHSHDDDRDRLPPTEQPLPLASAPQLTT